MGPEVLGSRWGYVCKISGLIFLQMDEDESARTDFERAVLAQPKSVSAHDNLALALGAWGSG